MLYESIKYGAKASCFEYKKEIRGEFNGFFIIKQIKKPGLCSVSLVVNLVKRIEHSRSKDRRLVGSVGRAPVC